MAKNYINEDNLGKSGLFDRIAPIYGLFFNYQTKRFEKILDRVQRGWDFSGYKNIVDIGCGTGALCSVLKQRGLEVTGVDPASNMLDVARKKTKQLNIDFIRANALERLPFADKSFDLSIASYVLHGLTANDRKLFYAEMNRITKHKVIIYEYTEKRAALTNVIEWLEGGDYFNFIKIAKDEIKEQFRDVHVLDVDVRAAWYIGTPKEVL